MCLFYAKKCRYMYTCTSWNLVDPPAENGGRCYRGVLWTFCVDMLSVVSRRLFGRQGVNTYGHIGRSLNGMPCHWVDVMSLFMTVHL